MYRENKDKHSKITIRIYEPTIKKHWIILLKAKWTFKYVDLSLSLKQLGKS